MNKAVPWNVNGVGFDAREAAREAARRQGKSLGEWLHGVIAERADDIGAEPDAMDNRQRVDAVTSKLERLSQRSNDHDRRVRAGRVDELAARRRDRDRETFADDESDDLYDRELRRRGRRPSRAASEATESLLEDAIEAMERRAERAERRADTAVQSVADLLRRNESRRDQEQDAVKALAQKLSDIEARLKSEPAPTQIEPIASEDSPIKGALARLEARLDKIGRRGVAEAAAGRPMPPTERPSALGQAQRLEDKLNTILEALHGRAPEPAPDASAIAMTAARSARRPDRRLGEAIAEIAQRQHELEGPGARLLSFDEARRGRVERPVAEMSAQAPFAAVQSEIAALASKIESLPRDLASLHAKAPPSAELDAVRTEIAAMSETLRDLAPRGRVADLEETVRDLVRRLEDSHNNAPRVDHYAVESMQGQMREIRDLVAATAAHAPASVERIEQQIAALTDRLDRPAVEPITAPRWDAPADPAPADPFDASTLENLVRDLGRKMEAVQAPEANHQALDALQDQIATLASRFENSDSGLAKLASLERSMRDLFVHLDHTRASVETTAAHAAREALRIAMEEGRAQTEHGAATSLAAMQALQDEADARTKSTLAAVHDTLEKVVDRLAIMETDVSGLRGRAPSLAAAPEPMAVKAAQAASDRSPKSRASLASADSFLDQILGQKGGEAAAPTPAKAKASDRKAADVDPDGARADFIAAARRAAKAAQADPSVLDFTQAAKTNEAVRAGLIEQTRDYVARHKRPVLLGMAALFVIVGTMAIMQRIGLSGSQPQMADATPPQAIERRVEAAPKPSRQLAELTPSALPKNSPTIGKSIPGSDPIQTGSIPSLPAFAAQSVAQTAPRPILPAGLSTMAKAGDAAAEYVLGTQYAEGRLVPRDFKLAANWYQKAADQGIAPAQYRLASLYEKGIGVAQDKMKARSLYIRAAEAGNPRAMHNLAVLLADGDGKPDYEGAATWFRKAAQYGVHDSQYNLAILLARGLGTQQSFVQSYQWFAIAATQNDSDAAKKRDEVGTKLSANDLAVAKALASSFRPKTADIAATDVSPPPGGWDGASTASPVNSARSKISSL